ncbi:MAG: hypothetical protein ABI433_16845 [Burkholderiaceae bacterium]
MSSAYGATADAVEIARPMPPIHRAEHPAHASAVSWGAILAGAAAAAALSMILLILGAGLGLSAISPWARAGVSGSAFGVSTIVWITVTQLMASGMGGYLAGRLRARWVAAQTDEVYFRDTAHGFLAWAVASLATAALLSSAIAAVVGGGVQAGASAAGGAAAAMSVAGSSGRNSVGPEAASTSYFVDSLFRREANAPALSDSAAAAPITETTRILLNSLRSGALPADDTRYLGQVIAQRTGLSQPDAEKRVSDTYARMQAKLKEAEAAARDAADKARKATAYATLWLFVSLLAGAFIASLAATWGGRQRDL